MIHRQMDEHQQQFLVALHERLAGNTAAQVSMYDIGAALGHERGDAQKIAESLMSLDAIEVKTLSGGIGLTEAGLDAARQLGAGGETDDAPRLGEGTVIEDAGRDGVEAVAAAVRNGLEAAALPFDVMSELIADLRSIDAQMQSPRPKTAILRECFLSVRHNLARSDDAAALTTRIERLLA